MKLNACLLDTNLFIQWERFIPFDIFPSFWNELRGLIVSGEALIHTRVYNEIMVKKDPLSKWVDSIQNLTKVESSSGVLLPAYKKVISWAKSQNYTNRALKVFAKYSRADAWLCAEALVSGYSIVTFEKASNSPNKVQIPNVCDGLNISHMDGFEYVKSKGFRF